MMPDRLSLNLLRLFVIAVAVVVTESFQSSKGDHQSLSNKYKWGLFAIENNNDKRNLTPAQRALQQTIRKERSISEFDQFKRNVYSGVDSIQNLTKGKPSSESKVMDGYSERKATLLKKTDPSTTISLFASDNKIQVSQDSPFDQMKGVLYGTLDLARKVITNKSEGSDIPQKRVDSLPVLSATETKSSGSLLSSQVLAELEPRLRSGNIISRLIAQVELTQLEGKERIRLQRLETQKKLQEVKEFVYSVVDGIKSFVDFVLIVPGEVQKVAESTARFAASIPNTVEDAVETVQSIPSKAKETVNGIQAKVENTVSTTKQFVAEVRDLPSTVQRKADETKQSFTKAIETVNDGATSVKVLVGLEKPKPRPPSTPPPNPPKASDVALKIAGFVFKTTGKVTWWLGKTVGRAAYYAIVKSSVADKRDSKKQMSSDLVKQEVAILGSTDEVQAGQTAQGKTAMQAPPSTLKKRNPSPPPLPFISQLNELKDSEKSSLKAPPSQPKQDSPENTKKKPTSARQDLSSLDEEVRNALQQAAEALEGAEKFKAKKKKESE